MILLSDSNIYFCFCQTTIIAVFYPTPSIPFLNFYIRHRTMMVLYNRFTDIRLVFGTGRPWQLDVFIEIYLHIIVIMFAKKKKNDKFITRKLCFFFLLLFTDILPSPVEHESSRTTMDHPDIIHRTDLRATLVGQFVVLQQRTLLRVFLHD